LVARSTQAVRQMPFFCSFAPNTASKFTRPLRDSVLNAMFFWANKRKIFQAVVERIPVFMVNVRSFLSICNHAVLVRPLVRLRDFYLRIDKTVTSSVQAFASYRQLNPNLLQNTASSGKDFWRKCFIGAVNAARGVVVRVPVRTLSSYNCSTAKGARFGSNFFHTSSIYQAS